MLLFFIDNYKRSQKITREKTVQQNTCQICLQSVYHEYKKLYIHVYTDHNLPQGESKLKIESPFFKMQRQFVQLFNYGPNYNGTTQSFTTVNNHDDNTQLRLSNWALQCNLHAEMR